MKYPGSLHNHTEFSNLRFRDCIIRDEELINYAIELGHNVVAITNHESVSDAVRIEKIRNSIQKNGKDIKVITGNEIYLCRNGLNADNFVKGTDDYYHFILLAKNRRGFEQICELSTTAWKRSYGEGITRRIPTYYQDLIDIIGSEPGNVIASTACLGGFLPTAIMRHKESGNPEEYARLINWVNQLDYLFGHGNFYLELQPSASKEQTYVNRKLIEISAETGVPYIITTDSHYLKEEDREAHKIYLKSQNADREVDSFYATTYLMSTEQLESHLDLTREEMDKAYENILAIGNMCKDYSIMKSLKIPSLPWNNPVTTLEEVDEIWQNRIPMLKELISSDFEGDKVLARAIIDGINKHPDLLNEEAYNEINENLDRVIVSSRVNKANWSAYFLNLQQIINLCWEAGSIVGPGRGSGVGFILLYVLDIIQVNPLREETKTYPWRFLNPERVSVLDVDFDIEGRKREDVLNKFREYYGEDYVSNVTTFRTEKTKSAILTAARGLDIDVDTAQYIASLVPADRGQLRSLKECYYGNAEKEFKPVAQFVEAMNQNSDLWNVSQKIEGLICGSGIHAGGVIFVDEPFTKSTALMRAPDGTICTQFDLHDDEDVSLIKYDALSVEAMDKIHICLDLLCAHGYVEAGATLKETYDKVLNVYSLEREDPKMWEMIWNHEILSLFQMEKQSGIQGIALSKPKSVNDLCVLNSVIRLMAPDKDSDTPLVTWSKYRRNISLWEREMKNYGLTAEEIEWLSHHSAITDGICESQQGLMSLVQEPQLGGNSLTFADKCRKGIAKKQGKLFQECEDTFYDNIAKNDCSPKLAHYVWDVLLKVQRGYSFNRSHCLAYSLVALQEMNLAYKYPTIFWDTACLISDSGVSIEEGSTDYQKIAQAIGTINGFGIKISPVDINNSDYIFKPDVENNTILYGLGALSGINSEIIKKIEAGRPYQSITDFMNRCELNKTCMVALIKGGAFDNIDKEWASKISAEPRIAIMGYYLMKVGEMKKKLTLSNFNGLMERGLIPDELVEQKHVFLFNKFLKEYRKAGTDYSFDDSCMNFYEKHFDVSLLNVIGGEPRIAIKTWEKLYKNVMAYASDWLKANQEETLDKINSALFEEIWNKYAAGSISDWEMDALCFYHHEHVLANVDKEKYGIVNYFDLPSDPEVDYYFTRAGRQIPIYKTYKLIGTVISKVDAKATVFLLTTTGLVSVKFTKQYYAMYNRQISAVQEDGTKKVVGKSWFSRGNKILVTGYRRGDQFVTKSYKHTLTHQLYKISNIVGSDIELEHEREA